MIPNAANANRILQIWQASAEWLYATVAGTVERAEGRTSVPFIFSMFDFVLCGTLLGLTPIGDTFTSHLAATLTLAFIIFFVG